MKDSTNTFNASNIIINKEIKINDSTLQEERTERDFEHNEHRFDYDMLVPISLFICVFTFLIVLRYLKHKENIKMIEKGILPSENALKLAEKFKRKRNFPFYLIGCIGIGWVVSKVLLHNHNSFVGIILISIAIGLFLEKKYNFKNNNLNDNDNNNIDNN